MKALTVHQPWASLIARGIKTVETRSVRTRYRGRVAIHAGKSVATWQELDAPNLASERWRIQAVLGALGVLEDGGRRWPSPWISPDAIHIGWETPLPLGAIVATAQIVECVPIVNDPTARNCVDVRPSSQPVIPALRLDDSDGIEHITELGQQAPFGDFTAGRWAWLLDGIKPTTERCPWCWGAGKLSGTVPGVPAEVCQKLTACPVCWPRDANGELEFWSNGRAGRCDPIPARGLPGFWRWAPGDP
jgi:hypothetical protein